MTQAEEFPQHENDNVTHLREGSVVEMQLTINNLYQRLIVIGDTPEEVVKFGDEYQALRGDVELLAKLVNTPNFNPEHSGLNPLKIAEGYSTIIDATIRHGHAAIAMKTARAHNAQALQLAYELWNDNVALERAKVTNATEAQTLGNLRIKADQDRTRNDKEISDLKQKIDTGELRGREILGQAEMEIQKLNYATRQSQAEVTGALQKFTKNKTDTEIAQLEVELRKQTLLAHARSASIELEVVRIHGLEEIESDSTYIFTRAKADVDHRLAQTRAELEMENIEVRQRQLSARYLQESKAIDRQISRSLAEEQKNDDEWVQYWEFRLREGQVEISATETSLSQTETKAKIGKIKVKHDDTIAEKDEKLRQRREETRLKIQERADARARAMERFKHFKLAHGKKIKIVVGASAAIISLANAADDSPKYRDTIPMAAPINDAWDTMYMPLRDVVVETSKDIFSFLPGR